MNAGRVTPTGKHAHCHRCYELAQDAWRTALKHGVNEWTAVDGDHAGRYNNPAYISDVR